MLVLNLYFKNKLKFKLKENEYDNEMLEQHMIDKGDDNLIGINDMTCLTDLNENSLLINLKARYEKNQIYVRIILNIKFKRI